MCSIKIYEVVNIIPYMISFYIYICAYHIYIYIYILLYIYIRNIYVYDISYERKISRKKKDNIPGDCVCERVYNFLINVFLKA